MLTTMRHSDFYLQMELLQNTLISTATNDDYHTGDYEQLRRELLEREDLRPLVPEYVISCRSLAHFWQFIKNKFSHYAERREFIWETFSPLLEHIELRATSPSDTVTEDTIRNLGAAYVEAQWTKCLHRRASDPEGAITAARSLIETVLRFVLDETKIHYKESEDLPSLYKKASSVLRLSPSQHGEEVFRQILSGIFSVINGFAALRNDLGDSHGKGKAHVRPSQRHARFAVDMAGSLSSFLFETYAARSSETQEETSVD